jgi:hypothetical protein
LQAWALGSTVRARRWFAQDVTVDPRLAAVALTMGQGALTAVRPRQKQTRPAAAWHHLGVAVVSFAWHGARPVLDSTNGRRRITYYAV